MTDPTLLKQEFDRLVQLHESAGNQPALWVEVAQGWENLIYQAEHAHDQILQTTAGAMVATVYLTLYEIRGEDKWAKKAETMFQKLRDAFDRSSSPGAWATMQYSQGTLFYRQYERHGNEDFANAAEEFYQSALQEFSPDNFPLEWASVEHALGTLFYRRYERRGKGANRAADHYRKALKIYKRKKFPAQWAMTQHDLGEMFSLRYLREGVDSQAHAAERYYKYALQVRRRDTMPAQWGKTQHALGVLYYRRYERTGDDNQARAVLRYYHHVLEVHTPDTSAVQWAITQHSLGNIYLSLYEHNHEETYAEAAEIYYQNALKVRRQDTSPSQWAMSQHALATLYFRLYERTKEENQGKLAEEHYQNALQEYTFDKAPALWASVQIALGTVFLMRYELSGIYTDSETAENFYRAALVQYRRDSNPAHWAMVQQSLGNLFLRRYGHTRSEHHARISEEHFRNALTTYNRESDPSKWAVIQQALGTLFQDWYKYSGNEAYASLAEEHYKSIIDLSKQFSLMPIYPFRASGALERLYFRLKNWTEVTRTYETVSLLSEELYKTQFTRGGKESWLQEAQFLPTLAAYSYCKTGNPELAVQILENGRTQLLREALENQRKDLARLPELGFEAEYDAYIRARVSYLDLVNSSEQTISASERIDRLEEARDQLNTAIRAIRERVGTEHSQYSRFMKSMSFAEIQFTATSVPLIYLVDTRHGCLAIIITKRSVKTIQVDTLTTDIINERLTHQANTNPTGGYLSALLGNAPIKPELDELLVLLGETLCHPLAVELRRTGTKAVVLIATGLLGLFPFHAAPFDLDRKISTTLLDEFEVSYAPSASSLRSSQESLALLGTPELSILAVGNPLPLPESYKPLEFAQLEVETISQRLFRQVILLEGTEATRELVEKNLDEAFYLHFACHGEFNPVNPLASGLILSDGKQLNLNDILEKLRLHQPTRLVVLSACKTALIDFSKLPEEAIGLPAGFMQAGTIGVIGTLWPVDDLSTTLLMAQFYEYHLKGHPEMGGKPLSPSDALRRAQLWLRDTTASDLRDYVKSFRLEYLTESTSIAIQKVYKRLMFEEDDSRPYKHPYYWAGYTFHGI